MTFIEALQREFDRRRKSNPRFSLRAFARAIGVDHSTLSQLMRGRRRVTPRAIAKIGPRIGMSEAQIVTCSSAALDATILDAIARKPFRASSRWIATVAGVAIDDVNVSLQRLLYNRKLRMNSQNEWRVE